MYNVQVPAIDLDLKSMHMVNTTLRIPSPVLLLLLLLCGCDLFSADSSAGDYLPLSLGNTWVYQSEYEQNGNPVERKVVIEEQIEINGKNYYVFLGDTIRIAHDIVLKRPGNKDVVWFNFYARDGSTYEYKVHDWIYTVTVRKDLTVEAHGREFSNCIGFFFDIPGIADDEISYTFAKGVGIVRISGAWTNLKLASFTLNHPYI